MAAGQVPPTQPSAGMMAGSVPPGAPPWPGQAGAPQPYFPTALVTAPQMVMGTASPARKSRGPLLAIIGAVAGAAVMGGVLLAVLGTPKRNRSVATTDTSDPIETPVVATPAPVAGEPEPSASPTSTRRDRPNRPTTVAGAPTAPSVPAPPPTPPATDPLASKPKRQFDASAAHTALAQAGGNAKFHCQGKDGPKAITANVFFSQAGNVQRVLADPQQRSTPSGLCMIMMLNTARVPPFDEPLEGNVTTTVAIP
jgi:hypothetical protein